MNVDQVLWHRGLSQHLRCLHTISEYPVEVLAALLSIQLPDNEPGKAADDCSSLGFLPPIWEAQMQFWVPDLGLVQPWLLASIWRVNLSVPTSPFSPSLHLSAFQVNDEQM